MKSSPAARANAVAITRQSRHEYSRALDLRALGETGAAWKVSRVISSGLHVVR